MAHQTPSSTAIHLNPSMPHQPVPLVFQKAFHGSVELLGIGVPQVLQQLLGLVQILFQVGFHDCLGMRESTIENRRLSNGSAPRPAAQPVPLTPGRPHQLSRSLHVGVLVVTNAVKLGESLQTPNYQFHLGNAKKMDNIGSASASGGQAYFLILWPVWSLLRPLPES